MPVNVRHASPSHGDADVWALRIDLGRWFRAEGVPGHRLLAVNKLLGDLCTSLVCCFLIYSAHVLRSLHFTTNRGWL